MTQENLRLRVRECLEAANNLIRMANETGIAKEGIQYTKWMYRAAGMVDVIRVLGYYVEFDKATNQYKYDF